VLPSSEAAGFDLVKNTQPTLHDQAQLPASAPGNAPGKGHSSLHAFARIVAEAGHSLGASLVGGRIDLCRGQEIVAAQSVALQAI